MPNWSATRIIGSGLRCSGPLSKNSRWASTTARIVGHLNLVAVVFLIVEDDGIGRDGGRIFTAHLFAGPGLQPAHSLPGRFDLLHGPAELLADLGIAVHLQVVEV